MTVRLLAAYGIYPANAIVTLDTGTETGLITAKLASANLAGGVAYTAPPAPNQLSRAQVLKDGAGKVLGLADANGNIINVGAIVATITGTGVVGSPLTATLPTGVVGTLQFTKTLKASPFTKSNIASAVANAVNSLSYTVQLADVPYNIGCDTSNAVSSSEPVGIVDPGGIITNYATRIYQLNAAFTSPRTAYNGATLIGSTETDVTGTSMLVTELEGEAESISLMCANMHTVTSRTISGFTVVCPSAIGDKKYDSLFATAPIGTFNGSATGTVPPRTAGDTHPAVIFSDEYPITTVARTDGGTKPLIAIREAAFYPANNDTGDSNQTNPAAWSAPYFTHSGADWGDTTKPGFYLGVGVRDNKLNAPFTATPTGSGNCTILGFRIKYKNRAATYAWFGSSYKKGDLPSLVTKKGAGYVMRSALAASTPTRPVEFINGGMAGQQLIKGRLAAEDIIPLAKPTHVVIEFSNPNDLSSVTTSTLNTLRSETNNIIAVAEANGARPMLDNGWARNTSSLPNTAPYFDAPMQTLLNSYLAEQQARGYPVVDTRTGMSAGTIPDTIKMIANGFPADYAISATGDGLHQTQIAEDEVLVPVATAALVAENNKYF